MSEEQRYIYNSLGELIKLIEADDLGSVLIWLHGARAQMERDEWPAEIAE